MGIRSLRKLAAVVGLVGLAAAVTIVLTTTRTVATAPPPSGVIHLPLGDLGDGQKSIATLSNGNVVVVGPGSGLNGHDKQFAVVLRPDGSFVADNHIPVEQTDLWDGVNGRVVALTGGGFAVVWIRILTSGSFHATALLARSFDNDGRPVTDEVVLGPNGVQGSSVGQVSAAGLADGGLAVVWEDNDNRLESNAYNPDLTPRHSVTRSEPLSDQGAMPPITGLAGGGYVYLYRESLYFFGSDGSPAATSPLDHSLGVVDIVGLPDGTIVATEEGLLGPAGQHQVGFVRLDRTGRLISQPTFISDPSQNSHGAKAAPLTGGGFVVTWNTYSVGLLAQTFSASGQPTNGTNIFETDSYQDMIAPAALAHDGYAVLWNGPNYVGVVRLFPGDPDSLRTDAVQLVYQAILGRPADPGGLAYWTDQLAGGNTPPGLAFALASSADGRARVITVDFLAAFGRPPDAGGLAFWSDRLSSTQRPDVIEAQLFSTDEAYQHAGGSEGLVRAFYTAYLLRTGDPGGVQYWTGVLARAGNSPGARLLVALFGFQTTAENLSAQIINTSSSVCGHPPLDFAQVGDLAGAYLEANRDLVYLAAQTLTTVCRPET